MVHQYLREFLVYKRNDLRGPIDPRGAAGDGEVRTVTVGEEVPCLDGAKF